MLLAISIVCVVVCIAMLALVLLRKPDDETADLMNLKVGYNEYDDAAEILAELSDSVFKNGVAGDVHGKIQ